MPRILAIDDDPRNLKLISAFLEGNTFNDEEYEITSASDGQIGWNTLEQEHGNFALILLDRMMPNMDGMTFLKKIKAHENYKNIPIIMQTAAAERAQVVEGIQAGVYHYLVKPYDEEILSSIVAAAIRDHQEQQFLQTEAKKQKIMLGLIQSCTIEFKTTEEAQAVATYISALFPEPARVVMGISELLINGVEHGNLGITYDEKSTLNANKVLREEIQRRLHLPEYQDKKVIAKYEKFATEIKLYIKDDGKGFDWQKYVQFNPDRLTDNHGRGIAMANSISFDHLEYLGCGNEVICIVKLK